MRSHVIALCGGVGGAKLAYGLAQVLAPHDLTVVVNTSDDFEHLGLSISPDLDTVLYTLAGIASRLRGGGLEGETWTFMTAVRRLGVEGGVDIGDQELATHVLRTAQLRSGRTLSEVTAVQAAALGVRHAVVPMSDSPVSAMAGMARGDADFGAASVGGEEIRPSPGLTAALARKDVSAVIVCPSSPSLSIDPILDLAGVREGIARLGAPVVAVSPIISREARPGSAAKLMPACVEEPSVEAVARHYGSLLSGLVVDTADGASRDTLHTMNIQALVTDAIMMDEADRVWLARETVDFARGLHP